MNRIKTWWHRHTHRTCAICGSEFRKHSPSLPSLVGFSYCTNLCENHAWQDWVDSTNHRRSCTAYPNRPGAVA